ncbi:6-phospho-beta-glucosidase [Entomospira entomophila]|uniref:6-phospho-beta-glucosidase n=1 Tax=Entomospira entomophila TaxID=2719988 RepID=A0A968KSC4_9SPIO|nr:6-phospho-beta-glucosidase [Entomospira entomophilus]NIZ40202.1 6-phospho-beta-glucosidase [Entomospira entomophilus]WDI35761.1 6-phospho-beta-glucosidase [Entomospira entomophilus]
MGKGLKVVTIGGGSSYTPEIVEGFIKRHKDLPIKELWLVDIEAGYEKLSIVGALAQRMVEKSGIEMKIHLTLNREEALKDADFVTTQLRVGLLDARIKDERIPLSHGMLGQETNGFGGFMKALRTIPVILEIAKEMEQLCPNAWLINFSNPSGMVTEAVQRYSKIKCIGLCNVPINMTKAVAEILGDEQFLLHFIGMNHYVWAKHLYYDGKDILPEMLPKILEMESERAVVKNIKPISWNKELILSMGMMPCPYHRYYYMHDDILQEELEDFAKGKTRAETVKDVESKLFALYKNTNLVDKPKELEERGGAYYSDTACDLIKAIYTDSREIMVVNVQNNNTIPMLPADAVIETSAMITRAGAIPLSISTLPEVAQSELLQLKTFERLTIEAAVTADYTMALRALTHNPLVKHGKITEIVFKELLQAHKSYLGQWNIS